MKDITYREHLKKLDENALIEEGRKVRSIERTLEVITTKVYWWVFVTLTTGIVGGLLQFMNQVISTAGNQFDASNIYTIVLNILFGYLIIIVGFYALLWHAYNASIEKRITYESYYNNSKEESKSDATTYRK